MTLADKRDMLETFLRGGSITAIAQLYATRRETIEDVIREGTQQILQQWVESEQAAEGDTAEPEPKVN